MIENALVVNRLNDLTFPDDYFWNIEGVETVITGQKEFLNVLCKVNFVLNLEFRGKLISVFTYSNPCTRLLRNHKWNQSKKYNNIKQ